MMDDGTVSELVRLKRIDAARRQQLAAKYLAGFEVQARLIDVVLRLVIASPFPVLENVRRFYFRVIGLEARHRKYRRDTLFDE